MFTCIFNKRRCEEIQTNTCKQNRYIANRCNIIQKKDPYKLCLEDSFLEYVIDMDKDGVGEEILARLILDELNGCFETAKVKL